MPVKTKAADLPNPGNWRVFDSGNPFVPVTNSSGIHPTEFKVLIEPKPVEQKSAGGIIIPESRQDHDKYAQTEGRIVAMSHLAFTYATPEEWGDKRPKPGDAVLYAKFAGLHVKGKDGKAYVLANDKDVCATIED
jgi:chaperonin GroES